MENEDKKEERIEEEIKQEEVKEETQQDENSELEELTDRYKRMLAEFENYKKRSQKETKLLKTKNEEK